MMEWKGAWSKDSDYTTGAVVTYGGGTYVALDNIAKNGTAPPSDAWGVVAAPPQPSVNWKGPWDPKTQYQINDVVSYSEEGSPEVASYIVVTVPPVGTKPTDRTYWEAMASNQQLQQAAWSTVEIVNTSISALTALFAGLSAVAGMIALKAGLAVVEAQVATALTNAGAAQVTANTALANAATAQTAANTAKGLALQSYDNLSEQIQKLMKQQPGSI